MIGDRAAKCLCAVPIGGVAAIAIGRQRAAIIAVHVAQGAGNGGVRAGQRKRCCAVIECGTGPIRRGVADRTVRWKRCGNVIRDRTAECGGRVPVCQMAAVAGGRTQRVIVCNVTGDAWRRRGRNVHARQCKSGRTVVERGRGPAHRRMAGGAVRRGE